VETRLTIAFVAALATTLALGPVVMPVLRRLKLGQVIRSDGPPKHAAKAGTPTMGGMLILCGMAAGILAGGFTGRAELTILGTAILCGLLGFWDDYLKVVRKQPLGLRARHKLAVQVLLGLGLSWVALSLGQDTVWTVPFTRLSLDLGRFYPLGVIMVVVATTNAVNLTDGLDGLASGVMILIGAAYVLVALATGATGAAGAVAAMVGGCLGFLRFNYRPAKVIMGDTGSMALGGALASTAVLTGTELLLPVIGAVPVAVTLSVILQVASFRLTGRRIFRMSPLHHHFELVGWSELQVVWRFWIATAVTAGIGLLAVGGLGK
jgi:phospho-N-acetylmuramoyl-pentapeptide-transferase